MAFGRRYPVWTFKWAALGRSPEAAFGLQTRLGDGAIFLEREQNVIRPGGESRYLHAGMNRADLYGLEYDWYATDRDGHIGHFSSAGYGPIPRRALDSPGIRANLDKFIKSLPKSAADLVGGAANGILDDWLQMAERGLFSYDYRGSERSYVLIARPSTPVSIEAYPEMIELAFALPILTDRCFALAESLSAEDIFDCD